jgi:exodeoxyribonuclease III
MSDQPTPHADTGGALPLRRLVSWNILEGMLLPQAGDETGDHTPDESRRRSAVTLIDRLKPDVLVLNEALYCEKAFGQVEKYADLFGFPHAANRLYDGCWGNAILSRHPVADVVAITIHRAGANQNRGMLAVRLGLPEGEVWVATYHPHPQRRPKKRLEDYAEFLPLLPGPLLFAGDMNAISPDDEPDLAILTRGFEHFRAKDVAQREVERFLEAGHVLFEEVMPRFGLHDAMPPAERRYTIPTAMLSTDISGAMRIDHILVNRGVVVEKAWVVRDPEADVASDHYPVAADFRLAGVQAQA